MAPFCDDIRDTERPVAPTDRVRAALVVLDAPDVLLVAELAERLAQGRREACRRLDTAELE